MINTIIAYDDFDENLGDYFDQSYTFIIDKTPNLDYTTVITLDGNDCTSIKIIDTLSQYNNQNYVFVALSHGKQDGSCILTTSEEYINYENAYVFKNSFFYSTACCAGIDIAHHCIEQGSKCFIGYNGVSKAPLDDKYDSLFIECELHALVNFLTSTKTIGEVFDEMIEYMDSNILELTENDEIIEAMNLIQNRDYIIYHGTEESKLLSRLDFSTE